MESASHYPALPDPPIPIAPVINPMHELSLARSHLAMAFQHLLTAVYLPIIAGVLCLANLLTYLKSHVRLCDITPSCEVLLSAPLLLFPLTLAFILAACFTLDHYLSVSPVFDPSKDPTLRSRSHNDNVNHPVMHPATAAARRPVRNDHGRSAKGNASGVLQIFTFVSYAFTALWVVSSLAAITGAGLVLKLDSPFDPNGGKTAFQDRVIFGFTAGAAHALLALILAWAAISI